MVCHTVCLTLVSMCSSLGIWPSANTSHFNYTWVDNKVRKLATVCLLWQHWTKALVWFDDVDISAFHSCVVNLWQSVCEWHLLMSACVLVCCHENVGV